MAVPKVSILIPNYNHEQYLPTRITSVLTQTFTDFELLLMDDCSMDGSRAVLEAYASKDLRIRLSFNKQNSGSTFRQWEKGLAQARGKYIWIAESDDFAEPTFLSELVTLLEADDTIALAYTNSTVVDEDDCPSGTTADWKNELFHTDHWSHDFIVDGRHELEQYLAHTCTINNASAVLFRRASIDAAGGVDSSLRYAGDWLMYLKLSLRGRIAYKAACLSNYRDHSANASKKSLADNSQLVERQYCFAFIYQSKALRSQAQERVLKQASHEFFALAYNLLRRNWQPKKMLEYVQQISAVSRSYYMNIQLRALSLLMRRQY